MNINVRLAVFALILPVATLAAEIPDPLVWYTMESVENGMVADKSGNGYHLKLGTSGVSLTNGYYGVPSTSLFFDGTKMAHASYTSPAFETGRTVSLWICREPASGPWFDENSNNNLYPYVLTRTPFRSHFFNSDTSIDNSMLTYVNSVKSYTTGLGARELWSHVVMTCEITDTETVAEGVVSHVVFKTYLNGVRKVVTDTLAITNLATAETFAVLGNNSTAGGRPIFGAIDEMRIWNSVLDDEQIVAEYARGRQDIGAQLIARWTFDETATSSGMLTVADSAGVGASAITCGPGMTLSDDGVEGRAIVCDGTSNTWGRTSVKNFVAGDYTWTLWFKQSPETPFDHTVKVGENNLGPRLVYHGNGSCGINVTPSLTSVGIYTVAGGEADQWTIPSAKTPGEWCHLAVVTRAAPDSKVYQEVYLNGALVNTTGQKTATKYSPEGYVYIGNFSQSGKRPFEGMIDDVRLYVGALPSNQVLRLYRGAAAVDAGKDFSVAGEKATLRGHIGFSAPENFRSGYAGTPGWTLVSAPTGGENAAILQAASPVTDVMLPVEGTYVFRLSNVLADVGLERHDDVTVTRLADAGVAPAVTLASATVSTPSGIPAELAAVVADGVRVSWAKVSGPGGVWFEPQNASTTQARFGEAGTYVVRCTAEKEGASTSADVTVTVTAFTRAETLADGLIRWWPMTAVNPYHEKFSGAVAKLNMNRATRLAGGPNGYAFRPDGYEGYFTTGLNLGESGTLNSAPTSPWRAISAWIYHDSVDTNTFKSAAIFAQPFTLGLWYDFKTSDGSPDRLTVYQQGTGGGVIYRYAAFPYDPTNRWMHVYALYDRSGGSNFEVWIDGVKRTLSGTGTKAGRVRGESIYIGGWPAWIDKVLGNSNGYLKNSKTGAGMSRCFPGRIADVRVYNRKLTEQEIRTLAMTFGDMNLSPALDSFGEDDVRQAQGKALDIATAVFDDGEPDGSALTYAWAILSGDASCATFGDAASRETTFTATKVGTYVLQLAVSDGERTAYSEPLTVEIVNAGLRIVIR